MKNLLTKPSLIILSCTLLFTACAKGPAADKNAVTGSEKTHLSQNMSDEKELQNIDTSSSRPQELAKVYFEFDQFTLSNNARDVLAANADILKSSDLTKVTIEGHCDSRGSDEYNLALGERRAQVVKDYLVSLGVDRDRLDTITYGEELPANSAGNEQAWALNRRAEFKVKSTAKL